MYDGNNQFVLGQDIFGEVMNVVWVILIQKIAYCHGTQFYKHHNSNNIAYRYIIYKQDSMKYMI